MTETPAQRRARALAERALIAATHEDPELRAAGERRKQMMADAAAPNYRSLLARLNGGHEAIERRP